MYGILETAGRRSQQTKICTSRVSIYFSVYRVLLLLSVQVQFGVTPCISDF